MALKVVGRDSFRGVPDNAKDSDYQHYLNSYLDLATKDIPQYMRDKVRRAATKTFNESWSSNGRKIPPKSGSPEEAVDKLLAAATKTKEENAAVIDEWLKGAGPQLEQAAKEANTTQQDIINKLTGAGQAANETEEAAIRKLVEGMPPEIKPSKYVGDTESRAAGAFASGESEAYQSEAMRKLQGLTTPEVTDKERFLEMRSRIQEEQSRKAAQEAALADLARRGIRSGGSEIAALTGAQQMTSQNRLMQDLGTSAGAVDRSMRAIEGLGDLSSEARRQSFDESFKRGSAADDISKFNKTQQQDYQQWRDKFKSDQGELTWGREKDVADATVTGVKDRYGRTQDQLGAETGAAKDAYGRTQDQINLGQTGVGLKVGAQTAGGQQESDAYKAKIGLAAEQAALASLKPQGSGLFGGRIIPGIL